MKLLRPTFAVLAALALFTPVHAQAPAAAPTMPAATSPAIPTRVAPSAAPNTAPSTAAAGSVKKIDINAASEAELATLPGIGPVTAKAIVDGRPWDDLTALSTKKVMDRPTFARNKDRFALADINTSSAAEIAKTLPGIGEKTAPKIVAGRPYATPQDLVTKKILTAAQFAKIKNVIAY